MVLRGLHDLLFEFNWDPFHISGTVKARNFKFGMQIDHGAVIKNEKLGQRVS